MTIVEIYPLPQNMDTMIIGHLWWASYTIGDIVDDVALAGAAYSVPWEPAHHSISN